MPACVASYIIIVVQIATKTGACDVAAADADVSGVYDDRAVAAASNDDDDDADCDATLPLCVQVCCQPLALFVRLIRHRRPIIDFSSRHARTLVERGRMFHAIFRDSVRLASYR